MRTWQIGIQLVEYMKNILLMISIIFHTVVPAEVEVWDCNELKGAKIVSSDGEYLGSVRHA